MSNNTISNAIQLISSTNNVENLLVIFAYQGDPYNLEFPPPETYFYRNISQFVLFRLHVQGCLQCRVKERYQRVKIGIISKLSSCIWKKLPDEFKREFKKYTNRVNNKVINQHYVVEKKMTKPHRKHRCSKKLTSSGGLTDENTNKASNNECAGLEVSSYAVADDVLRVRSLNTGFTINEDEPFQNSMINSPCQPSASLEFYIRHNILNSSLCTFNESVPQIVGKLTPPQRLVSQSSTASNGYEVRNVEDVSRLDVNIGFNYEISQMVECQLSNKFASHQDPDILNGVPMHYIESNSIFDETWDFITGCFPTSNN
ncbi:3554_t:CDS:1 [Cetraspora pellucida]|uniref:3554_t:CDS:1 n=1 Tax=Cetraspora pellucida TaxID=1433469 RepID=A0ACA9KT20_9GLOM|nr:3554_t:CDS:1 [Cetraspora pellucida]